MDTPSIVNDATRALLASLLVACGAATPTPGPTPEPAEETSPTWVELRPPGSRIVVTAPPSERIPHTLRYRTDRLELRFADATVEAGAERHVAEAYLAQLSQDEPGEISHRPFVLGGAEGLQITVRTEQTRIRALTLWHDGAISRVTILHHPDDAGAAERVIESLRFDPHLPLDPRAALDVDADPIEGLPLLRVSTEQLLFREAGHAVAFPSPEAAMDITYVAFDDEPPDERARGHMLGSRFRGLPIDPPRVEAIDGAHFEGFAIQTRASIEGTEFALMGAYLEMGRGALLVRTSIAVEREPEWTPRFVALIRSLREP